MRVSIDGVGTFEVSEVAVPQLMAVIEANKAVSLESASAVGNNYSGEQLINE